MSRGEDEADGLYNQRQVVGVTQTQVLWMSS